MGHQCVPHVIIPKAKLRQIPQEVVVNNLPKAVFRDLVFIQQVTKSTMQKQTDAQLGTSRCSLSNVITVLFHQASRMHSLTVNYFLLP